MLKESSSNADPEGDELSRPLSQCRKEDLSLLVTYVIEWVVVLYNVGMMDGYK